MTDISNKKSVQENSGLDKNTVVDSFFFTDQGSESYPADGSSESYSLYNKKPKDCFYLESAIKIVTTKAKPWKKITLPKTNNNLYSMAYLVPDAIQKKNSLLYSRVSKKLLLIKKLNCKKIQ